MHNLSDIDHDSLKNRLTKQPNATELLIPRFLSVSPVPSYTHSKQIVLEEKTRKNQTSPIICSPPR